jgi:hypothetical protein
MTEDQRVPAGADLVEAIRGVLRQSPEPLTKPRIRERLPERYRSIGIEELTDTLNRQVAAQVFVICPKYRSSQDRYWDRPLRTHALLVLQVSAAPCGIGVERRIG